MAIAGDDYAIVGGCTRMSTGYEILSRTQSKLFDLYVPQENNFKTVYFQHVSINEVTLSLTPFFLLSSKLIGPTRQS